MAVELGQKPLNLEEINDVSTQSSLVRVGRILSNELSDSIPKKMKVKDTELINLNVSQNLRRPEYLRAYLLITLSSLARMKKAGRKGIVELLRVMINRSLLPKGATQEGTNVIECLAKSLCKGGEVEKNGENKSFADVLQELSEEEHEEEEEKVEAPELLETVSPQEKFILNSQRTFHLAVAAIEVNKLERLAKKLFTSFALSSQALGVAADAFSAITITQGLNHKSAQLVRNSILALIDKSQALGKKSTPEEAQRVADVFTLLMNLVQFTLAVAVALKTEINSEVYSLFLDKKADAMQDFIDRKQTSVVQLINGLNDVLALLVKGKMETIEALKDTLSESLKELEQTANNTSDSFEKLAALTSLLQRVSTREEFLASNILREQDRE